MTNLFSKQKALTAKNESVKANDLNSFDLRFETDDSKECLQALKNVNCEVENGTVIDLPSVISVLRV